MSEVTDRTVTAAFFLGAVLVLAAIGVVAMFVASVRFESKTWIECRSSERVAISEAYGEVCVPSDHPTPVVTP